jgi:lysophospholipase L1-like esterase
VAAGGPASASAATLGAGRDDAERAPGGLRHKVLRSSGNAGRLDLAVQQGRPQLFGVVVEGNKPGVVLDTVGLNGARATTFLGWDEATWVSELARRKPDLVVLAFGTNESSDPAPTVERYARPIERLVARARAAAPAADCLVILPMDRGGHEFVSRLATISQGMAEAAHKAGCATWSALDAMGGAGSMDAWAHEHPARAGSDGLHLTGRGYMFLGSRLAADLLPSPTPAVKPGG